MKILLALLLAPFLITPAFGSAEDPTCIEQGNCGFASDPLGTMLMPFDMVFGGLSIVIFWGVIVGILWIRTENPALVSIIGIAMSAAYMATLFQQGSAPPQEWDSARTIGGVLVCVSIGIGVYQIINSRVHAPPQ